MRRALVISHEPDCGARQIEVRLRERGFAVETHVVAPNIDQPNVATPWPDFDDYDLVVPMGSMRSLTRKEEIDSWVGRELELLKQTHDRGTPVLGICFGGQLLAEALGGSVESAPVTEIGWFEIEAPDGVSNPVGPGPWKEWHHDRFTPPAEATVLAENENAVQLFQWGRTVGTQFHPEIDVEHLSDWLETAPDEYLDENGLDRDVLLAEMAEHEDRNIKQCHALVDWFLDEVAFVDTAAPGVSA